MTARIILAALILAATVALAWYGPRWVNRMGHPAPMDPSEPDERDESGADDQYGPELRALKRRERELAAVAKEHGLDLLNVDERDVAEEVLALRLSINERIDHFRTDRLGGLENWLDEWAPGWWEEAPTTVLPTFVAVHALIDDTREHRLVNV